jgi:hypothetical protein
MTTSKKRAIHQQRLSKRGAKRKQPPRKGAILQALRRSPLVGAGLDLRRPREQGRKVEP